MEAGAPQNVMHFSGFGKYLQNFGFPIFVFKKYLRKSIEIVNRISPKYPDFDIFSMV
jgi:hypothetical protein